MGKAQPEPGSTSVPNDFRLERSINEQSLSTTVSIEALWAKLGVGTGFQDLFDATLEAHNTPQKYLYRLCSARAQGIYSTELLSVLVRTRNREVPSRSLEVNTRKDRPPCGPATFVTASTKGAGSRARLDPENWSLRSPILRGPALE